MATRKDLQHTVPNRYDLEHVDGLGVQVIGKSDLELECVTCGARWKPQGDREILPPNEYWRCPNRCNS